MSEKHTCPRRVETGMDRVDSPVHDSGPDLDGWRDGKTCDYCGSLHPDAFMQAIADGKVISPTDKNYKAYVTEPLSEEQKAKYRQQHIANSLSAGMSAQDAAAAAESAPVLGEGAHLGKFYYQHLSEQQRQDFVDLLSAKKIVIGYPGYFYRLPFFVGVARNL